MYIIFNVIFNYLQNLFFSIVIKHFNFRIFRLFTLQYHLREIGFRYVVYEVLSEVNYNKKYIIKQRRSEQTLVFSRAF